MFVFVSRPGSPHSELLKKSERIMNFVNTKKDVIREILKTPESVR